MQDADLFGGWEEGLAAAFVIGKLGGESAKIENVGSAVLAFCYYHDSSAF